MTENERLALEADEDARAEMLDMLADEDALWEEYEEMMEAERARTEAELQEQLQMMEFEDRISGCDFE
jgi:hypothetical protein